MERDILKKPSRTLRRRSCPVRAHEDAAAPVSAQSVMSGVGGVPKRLLCLATPPSLKARSRQCAPGSGDSIGTCTHPADIWTGAPSGQHLTRRISAIDGRTTRHAGYAVSQQKQKRVEEVFGWLKTVGLLRKVKLRGVPRVGWLFTFVAAVYNLVRMRNLRETTA